MKVTQNLFNESEFTSEKVIGNGATSEVVAGTFADSETKVAVKYVSNSIDEKAFTREVELMDKVKHPHVLAVLGTMDSKKSDFSKAVVTEYMSAGSLYELLKSNTPLSWESRLNIAINVAEGLMHMHSMGILHGDLKSLNILLDDLLSAKIGDFGSAIEIKDSTHVIATDFGTRCWQAPELFHGAPVMTKESDIYSLGVVMGELVTRKIPENTSNMQELIAKKVNGSDNQNFYEPTEIEGQQITDSPDKIMGKTLWDISQLCQSLKPEDRPDLKSVIQILRATLPYVKDFVTGSDQIQFLTPFLQSPSTIQEDAKEIFNTLDEALTQDHITNSSLLTFTPLAENPVVTPSAPSKPKSDFSFGKCFSTFFKASLYSEHTAAAVGVALDFIEQTRGFIA